MQSDQFQTRGECLTCYLQRALRDFGCDNTLRWAKRWRDAEVPGASRLEHQLEEAGGFCDCEVLLNVHPNALPADESDPPPSCVGVPAGSTRPCGAARG